jgi:tight adherence protein B
MTLIIITILVFLMTMGLLISAAYFFLEVPAAKRQVRVRLASLQQVSIDGNIDFESQVVHDQILSTVPALNRILLQFPFIPRLQLFMTQAAIDMPIGTLLCISISLLFFASLISILARMPALMTLIAALGAGSLPFVAVAMKRRRRLRKFEELFPDAIDLLARAVRAGHAFTTGFSLIANEMPEPIAGEFRTTFEQQNLGLPLGEALRNLTIRVPLPDVRIFLAALTIQRESGGNLGEILDNLSIVIRERFKIYRQVQVFTAEGRLSLYILTAMPPISAVIMYLTNPSYMMRLFTDPLGHQFIAAAIAMQIVGYFVIRRIVRIKV